MVCYFLQVYVPHFFLIPWWVMLCEVISCILFTCCPYEVKHVLFYSVFDPVVPHIEVFGDFGSHVGCEYAVCCAIIGLKGFSVCRLWVSYFYEGYAYWATVSGADVDAYHFSF